MVKKKEFRHFSQDCDKTLKKQFSAIAYRVLRLVSYYIYIYMTFDPQVFVHSGPNSKKCRLMAGYGSKRPRDPNAMWGPKVC